MQQKNLLKHILWKFAFKCFHIFVLNKKVVFFLIFCEEFKVYKWKSMLLYSRSLTINWNILCETRLVINFFSIRKYIIFSRLFCFSALKNYAFMWKNKNFPVQIRVEIFYKKIKLYICQWFFAAIFVFF